MSLTVNDYDIVIIGAGPAGLTAGIYAARSGLKTVILEERIPGGQLAGAAHVENYPGLKESITGSELSTLMELQAKKFGAQIKSPEKAVDLKLTGKTKIVKTEKNTYNSNAVILSLGAKYRRLRNVPGADEFRGKGVSYCPTCDGNFFKGKKVFVLGGGNTTAMSAIYLSALASSVKIVHRRKMLRAEHFLVKQLRKNSVDVIFNSLVKEIQGDGVVKSIVLEDQITKELTVLEADGLFVQIGEDPNSSLAKNAGVETDEHGYIIVDSKQRTNIEGVYAAGDVTNNLVKQIGTAVGQGITAAWVAFCNIKKPYYYT